MEGVQRKQGGDKRAAPGGRGEGAQQEKEQDGIGGVKHHVGQVRTRRIQAVKLAIEHV